ncbi:MAG TPA: PLP-dependent aminotransferase family protein [Candidatus Limnocylindrales bacterium]|nr:PLP-dependent aminotransferase family protein [Candidatus Limnocylindrales bacterium]
MAATPLYRQIELQLRDAILAGRLRPGAALPGIRAFARELGVAAITVITAYDQLAAEGFLDPRPGRGTLVSADLAAMQRDAGRRRARPRGGTAAGRVGPDGTAGDTVRRPALPAVNARGPVTPFFTDGWPIVRFDFRTGATRLDVFPNRIWERCIQAAWRDLAMGHGSATSYLEPEGDALLRRELAAYLARSRAAHADEGQLVITAGAQGALAIAARVWLREGRRLAVEDPGSPYLQRTFRAQGVGLEHVPVDDRGLPVDRLPGDVAAVMVTPSWQYPSGGTMPIARRLQLLDWAAERSALVIEDDCDSELRYEGHSLPSLQGLDQDGRVLYVGTFSKVLYPGLRTGYAIVPQPAVGPYVAQLEAAARGPGAIEQRALARFIADGQFERHLGRLRAAFAERQAALVEALERELGRVVSAAAAPGGSHLVVRIEDGRMTATELARRAIPHDVAIEPLAGSAHHPIPDREFLMHYGRLRPDEIRAGVERLARAAADRPRRAIA